MTTCRTIAVCSAPGGVGKTTVAVRLAHALGISGERCALVDLDPRGCASGAVDLSVVWTVGFEALGPIRPTDVEDRVCPLVARLATDANVVVLDCPPESPGRVGPITGAALTAARAGGPGSGALAVMSPAAPDPSGTAELLARCGPGAVLGVVVNRVRDSTIEASHHDVARCLGAPVLARVPALEHPDAAEVVDDAMGVLAGVLTSEAGVATAWAELQVAVDESTGRDAELAQLLEGELARLELDPEGELDAEFELGLELLRNRRLLKAARGLAPAVRPAALSTPSLRYTALS
jgi:hypothetical protein